MKIPFVDLSRAHSDRLQDDTIFAIGRVVASNTFLYGPEVEAFEAEWAAYCGQKHCIACANGTDAVFLASLTGHGNFSVQANTCPYTYAALARQKHVFVKDVNGDGWPIKPEGNTIPVLLYGRYLYDECKYMIVDACQAHGWKPPAGCVAAWSFYPSKNLGTFGDGGAITTDVDSFAKKIREEAKNWHSRMSEINAAVLRVKLPYLDQWNADRAAIAEIYYNELPDKVKPVCKPGWPSNHHIFGILTDYRPHLQACLHEWGVGTKIHYDPAIGGVPGAMHWASRELSLPCYPGLRPDEVQYVCDCICTFYKTRL